jgi:uncharacterized protein DUF6624
MTARRPDLAAELLRRMTEDQRLRALPAHQRTRDTGERLRAIDAENAAALKRIVDEHGWPGHALVGEQGAKAAWLLAQHADSDPDFQRRACALLGAAVEAGDASPVDFAYLIDRLMIQDGLPQRYGTQYVNDSAGLRPHPIEDPDRLDQRRAAVALPPHAEYDATMRREYAGGGG